MTELVATVVVKAVAPMAGPKGVAKARAVDAVDVVVAVDAVTAVTARAHSVIALTPMANRCRPATQACPP